MTPVTRTTACLAAAGLVLTLPGVPTRAAPSPAHRPASYGSTTAPDGVLRSGCRQYAYRYTLTTPTGD